MRLNKIELSGFKSFAKTTVLDFPSPISAVIGPNGSGKSNVVEAIRWALGEQSFKNMRAKKGEDLIFNGTPTVARPGKARVKLVFDNSKNKLPIDYQEVVLERNVFRDGNNDYILNNTQTEANGVLIYEAPNAENLPDYWRTDVSAIYDFKLSKDTKAQVGASIWNIFDTENSVNSYYIMDSNNHAIQVENVALGLTPNLSFRVSF